MYEYSTFKACTGLLIRNSAGKVLHGRNLDFYMMELLSKLIVNVEYYRGNKRIYSVDTVVGSAFAPTGIRHGAFAVNANTRKAKHFYNDLISIFVDDGIPAVWLLRKVLEEEETYASALKRIKTERISGPIYYIISGVGPNEGAVIERETNGYHGFYELSDTTWFLVQTNYDRDQPDPVHDPRRIPVENRLRERGNIHLEEQNVLDDFMSIWPTFNAGTIMTAIMVPETGYHNTTVWYAYNPSPPPSSEEIDEE